MVEFAASKYINTSIRLMLFLADSRLYLHISIKLFGIYNDGKKIKFLVVNQIVKKQDKMMKFL